MEKARTARRFSCRGVEKRTLSITYAAHTQKKQDTFASCFQLTIACECPRKTLCLLIQMTRTYIARVSDESDVYKRYYRW